MRGVGRGSWVVVLLLGGCSALVDPDGSQLGGAVDAGGRDAASGLDASGIDAPGTDAPGVDAPGRDAPGIDVGRGEDTGPVGVDTGPPDMGPPDMGPPDMGPPIDRYDGIRCGGRTCPDDGPGRCCINDMGSYCSTDECRCEGLFCFVATLECDGPEDCGRGQICCAEQNSREEFPRRLSCRDRCDNGTFTERTEICHPGEPDACRDGGTCMETEGGYGFCG